jgi:predicted transposase/invertase (TIGR01784 family)
LEEAMKGAISWCIRQDILKDFLERNASEVMNMLMSEWNWDDAFAVQRAEGREEGLEKGRGEGREESQQEIARKALAEGLSPEFVQKITGLDLETIGRLPV